MASLYKRGSTYWLKSHLGGQVVRESLGTTSLTEARTLRDLRVGAVARGEQVRPHARRIRVADLLRDLTTEYGTNGRKSLPQLTVRIDKHLLPAFGKRRAVDLTTAEIRDYLARRQTEGAENATINRELATLKRAYRLAVQDNALSAAPYIPMLRENNVRQGFFEAPDFHRVREHLPAALQPFVTVAYLTGWRTGELKQLQWRHVDFAGGVLRLDPGTTKSGAGRTFPLTAEVRATLEEQRATTRAIEQETSAVIPWVFHRRGRPIRTFRRAWLRACAAAGCPGKIVHDFRRTSVRNLGRANITDRVAMELTGHATRSVFDRYSIVSATDIAQAGRLLDAAAERGGSEQQPRAKVVRLEPTQVAQ
jgi:integrase